MIESLKLSVDCCDGVVVVYIDGYINNQGGEEIVKVVYEFFDEGYKVLLFNLVEMKIVNLIGILIFIEIIEKMFEVDGKLVFCNFILMIDKIFYIMGFVQYMSIFQDEVVVLEGLIS